MKEFKYTIDGKEYNVSIGDIENNVANVTVNGEDFQVEMEAQAEPESLLRKRPRRHLQTWRMSIRPMPSRLPSPEQLSTST